MNNHSGAQSIRRKLLFILMLMSFVATAITTISLLIYETHNAEQTHKEKLKLISTVITPSLTAAVIFDDTDTVMELIEPIVLTEGVFRVKVTNKNKIIADVLAAENTSEVVIKKESVLEMDGISHGVLTLYSDNSVVEKRISFYKVFIIQLFLGICVLSMIVSLVLSRLFTKPLLNLTAIAKKITSSSDYNLRAQQVTSDEIGELTDCFNTMLETIEHRDKILESKVFSRTQELEVANSQLHLQANEDALSGLPNRRAIYNKLQELIDDETSFSLLFIDLDGFKRVNDTLGHDYGDTLLKQVSCRIVDCVRKSDSVARLGGDEFTVILKNLTSPNRIDEITAVILKELSEPFDIEGESVYVSGSLGVTLYPEDGCTVDSLVKNADQAMYVSKNLGKNCCSYFCVDMQKRVQAKKILINDLRLGIEREEFELHYQPIFCLKTNTICKAEALMRWRHPDRGLLSPDEFLSTVEDEGFINEIGYQVAMQASSDVARWMNVYNSNIQISINISPNQLNGSHERIHEWLCYIGNLNLNTKNIVVEITEHSLMEYREDIRSTLEDMRKAGIAIAIDDFGVGYSSLSYLQQLDLDILKIDRSFIHNLSDPNSLALCKAIITIAHELGLSVVAEGIENEMQRDILAELGCDFGQGYFLSKPLPYQQFENDYINNDYQLYKT
jgi:diguanylate cyclase (GGDEF)-like protein